MFPAKKKRLGMIFFSFWHMERPESGYLLPTRKLLGGNNSALQMGRTFQAFAVGMAEPFFSISGWGAGICSDPPFFPSGLRMALGGYGQLRAGPGSRRWEVCVVKLFIGAKALGDILRYI